MSLKWLKDWVEVDVSARALSDALTFAGLEVEGIDDQTKNLDNVVTGLILEKTVHPQADRLSVCQVMTQTGVVHQIVCGAKNHSENDRVVVALPGAILPGDFHIQKTVLRGVESAGMLCSESELGLKTESEGILLLPKDAPLGVSIAEYLGLDDIIFDLKVTPNRADCLSHLGLAREIASLLEKPLRTDALGRLPDVSANEPSPVTIQVDPRAADACPLYSGIYLGGVESRPTPPWIKQRLESVGVTPINLIVDITNYVLMEFGQPLHAFDVAKLITKSVHVRPARAHESMTTFDGTKLSLSENCLVISDGGEQATCLAGIIGSRDSGIAAATENVFLESAVFSASSIRGTARQFGLQTDASYRFARGVDPSFTELALRRAVQLLQQSTRVGHVSQISKVQAHEIATPAVISVTLEKMTERLGYPTSLAKLKSIFERLHCGVESTSKSTGDATENSSGDPVHALKVTPPTFRMDLKSEVDLVEEVARLIGYDKIPAHFLPLTTFPSHSSPTSERIREIQDFLVQRGMTETIHSIFVSREAESRWLGSNEWERFFPGFSSTEVTLLNPLSREQALLRRTLSLGLWDNAQRNLRAGHARGKIFEIGTVFRRAEESGSESRAGRADLPTQEKFHVGFCLWGEHEDFWNLKNSTPRVFELKGIIEQFCQNFLARSFRWKVCNAQKPFHLGQTAIAESGNQAVGFLAAISPEILSDDKIRAAVIVGEIEIEIDAAINSAHSGATPLRVPTRYKNFSRFPSVSRDLAIVFSASDTNADEVMQLIRTAAESLLKDITLFDVYPLGDGTISLGFRLTFQSDERTLTDTDVQKTIEDILAKFTRRSIRLRT